MQPVTTVPATGASREIPLTDELLDRLARLLVAADGEQDQEDAHKSAR